MQTAYTPPDTPLNVLHVDHGVLAVSKPDGLLSVPGRGAHLADCLLSRVQVAFPAALLVHRLDRDTSGVMVFGLSPHAQRLLSKQFEEQRVCKSYVARVAGRMAEPAGEIDLPLIADWPNRPRQMVCHATGKPSLTVYEVLHADENESRVQLRPRTGRTHQLRVHLLALGHPVLGDPLYAPGDGHARMMLHAEELRITHPESGRDMRFRAPLPF